MKEAIKIPEEVAGWREITNFEITTRLCGVNDATYHAFIGALSDDCDLSHVERLEKATGLRALPEAFRGWREMAEHASVAATPDLNDWHAWLHARHPAASALRQMLAAEYGTLWPQPWPDTALGDVDVHEVVKRAVAERFDASKVTFDGLMHMPATRPLPKPIVLRNQIEMSVPPDLAAAWVEAGARRTAETECVAKARRIDAACKRLEQLREDGRINSWEVDHETEQVRIQPVAYAEHFEIEIGFSDEQLVKARDALAAKSVGAQQHSPVGKAPPCAQVNYEDASVYVPASDNHVTGAGRLDEPCDHPVNSRVVCNGRVECMKCDAVVG